jgi:hypothetical protein
MGATGGRLSGRPLVSDLVAGYRVDQTSVLHCSLHHVLPMLRTLKDKGTIV